MGSYVSGLAGCALLLAACGKGETKTEKKPPIKGSADSPTTSDARATTKPPITATGDVPTTSDARAATSDARVASGTATIHDVSSKQALIAVLERMTGNDLEDRDVCVIRPESFPHLVVIGYFAHDAGCRGDEVFYKGVHYSHSAAAISAVMTAMGWKDSEDTRKKLALAWTTEVIQAYEGVMSDTKAPERFSAKYNPPAIDADADGAITVAVWIQEDSGPSAEDYYRRAQHRFAADGRSVTVDVLETIVVERNTR